MVTSYCNIYMLHIFTFYFTMKCILMICALNIEFIFFPKKSFTW